jgi:hypothetical protein
MLQIAMHSQPWESAVYDCSVRPEPPPGIRTHLFALFLRSQRALPANSFTWAGFSPPFTSNPQRSCAEPDQITQHGTAVLTVRLGVQCGIQEAVGTARFASRITLTFSKVEV